MEMRIPEWHTVDTWFLPANSLMTRLIMDKLVIRYILVLISALSSQILEMIDINGMHSWLMHLVMQKSKKNRKVALHS